MDRIKYYDRLVKHVVIYGVAAAFTVVNLVAIFFIE